MFQHLINNGFTVTQVDDDEYTIKHKDEHVFTCRVKDCYFIIMDDEFDHLEECIVSAYK